MNATNVNQNLIWLINLGKILSKELHETLSSIYIGVITLRMSAIKLKGTSAMLPDMEVIK
jgi:hypothetical protein